MAAVSACVHLAEALQRPSPKRPWDGHTMPCDRVLLAKHGWMTMNNNRWRKPWGWRCRARASTLYDLLSVPQGVDLAGIKSAYRQLVKMYHPDVCPAVNRRDFSQKFLKVQEAYETLSDPLLRATYDDRLLRKHNDGSTVIP